MNPEKYVELYLTESRDHLTAINQALIELEHAPGAREPVDSIFRAVHTVKGMSGVMGYDAVGSLAHAMESLLARVRAGDEALSPERVTLLFDAADALEEAIEGAAGTAPSALDVSSLVERLTSHAGMAAAANHRVTRATLAAGPGLAVAITLEPGTSLPGARALIALARLRALGTVHAVSPDESTLTQDGFDGRLAVRLETTVSEEEIVRAVRGAGFVRDVHIERATNAAVSPDAGTQFDEAWRVEGLKAPLQRYVRIDLRRLDQLMNLVGELVIARGQLARLGAAHDDPALHEAIDHASRLVGELQDGVLGGRMVAVWQIFDRFPRVVRDAARTLGKEVEFVVQGREIELDRALLEQIADPLVHLLRNAIDHGIEAPDVRAASHKPIAGRLVLSAVRERSAVVIRVTDDGRGVNRAKVLNRARDAGLVDPEREELTDEELLRVIARPGFTTAERVTDLSGRGVGIDAVIARVRQVGGAVDLRSEEGKGSTFTLRLPVTLAIIPALMARVGDETYALPLTHVTETLRLRPNGVRTVRGREVIVLRDDVLPLLHLRDVVSLPRRDAEGSQIVVLEMADRRAGLVVDQLLGQQEIVVKPFDTVRDAPACFNGATIMGDGAPALILEVSSLLQERA